MASPEIAFLPASNADSDPALISRLTDILNVAYPTEADIFVPGYKRIDEAGLREVIRAGELAVAYQDRVAIGCIRVVLPKPGDAGEFGLFATDTSVRGSGIGRALVDFAESHCRNAGMREMQLELLIPTWIEGGHPFKNRLHEWYTRLGYKVTKVETLEEHYPELAPLLRGRCDYTVYRKPLV
ncbi:Triacylglycerol lipase [Mycena kentingensis (nom. inval.)]|nr:Triacylglycerol lipase [Mycena kentingensis (nom. inval.)]